MPTTDTACTLAQGQLGDGAACAVCGHPVAAHRAVTTTTVTEGGYLRRGDDIVRPNGDVIHVDRWEPYRGSRGNEVAVFDGPERYLFGISERVLVDGIYPDRAV